MIPLTKNRLPFSIACLAVISFISTSEYSHAQQQLKPIVEVDVDEEALEEAFRAGDYGAAYQLTSGYAEAGVEDLYYLACGLEWFGLGTSKSVNAALRWCAQAENKDEFSETVVAIVHFVHERLDVDTDQPDDYLRFVEEKAIGGDIGAMKLMAAAHRLGVIGFNYERGEPAVDRQSADAWMRRAAEAGDPEALVTVARPWMASSDPELRASFVTYMERAAEQGYVLAASYLSTFYLGHSEGAPSSTANEMLAEALKWARVAANLDPSYSMSVVYILQDINEPLRDQDEAIKWMRLGAEAGSRDAMMALADAFLSGEGVRRNLEEATKWYHAYFATLETEGYMPPEAARAGLGLLTIAHEKKNHELMVETFPRLLRAAQSEHFEILLGVRDKSSVQYALGVAFRDGIGLEKNLDKALQYFSAAAEYGHAVASRERDFIKASRASLSADDLRAIQAQLAQQGRASYGGYLMGPIDGIWGRSTFNALRAWQCAVGAPITGQINERLVKRIEEENGNVRYGTQAWTARLFDAIDKGDPDCILAAIVNGGNVSAVYRSSDVFESLGYALGLWDYQEQVQRAEKLRIARILLARGAPARIGSIFSFISDGDHQIVDMFLDRGVNPLGQIEGKTLLEWAAYYDQPRVAEVLIRYGALPLSKKQRAQERLVSINGRGLYPGGIHKAREAFEAGAKVNTTGSKGETALVQVLRGGPITLPGQLNYLRFLLDAGADPNKMANAGFRNLDGIPLHILIFFNQKWLDEESEYANKFPMKAELAREALQLLIENGAKIGARDSSGKTPLHIAAEVGSLHSAQVLISKGALLDVRDDTGRRPIDYAEDADVIAFLLNPSPSSNEPEGSEPTFGSGFVVTSSGHVITNSHVVEGCSNISASWPNMETTTVDLIASDPVNDIAVLAISAGVSNRSYSPIPIRSKDANLGESILVAGFPFGDMVSSELKVTSGIVNSLKGPGNDVSRFQLDAAIQQGNSGGPIFDRGGNVIGMIVSQLDKRLIEKKMGSIPENMNFGIKASTLETFLSSNDIQYIEGTLESLDSVESVAQTAKNVTVMLKCQ